MSVAGNTAPKSSGVPGAKGPLLIGNTPMI